AAPPRLTAWTPPWRAMPWPSSSPTGSDSPSTGHSRGTKGGYRVGPPPPDEGRGSIPAWLGSRAGACGFRGAGNSSESGVPGQYLHDGPPGPSGRRFRRRRELRGRLGEGTGQPGDLRPDV